MGTDALPARLNAPRARPGRTPIRIGGITPRDGVGPIALQETPPVFFAVVGRVYAGGLAGGVYTLLGMRKQIGLKLDVGLLGRVDAAAAELGLSRTAWVEWALDAALGGVLRMEGGRAVVRAVAADVEVRRPAVRSVHPRVVSSAGAKVGVVPVWRGTGTD